MEQKRAIGYLCPACRKSVVQERAEFALAASGAVVTCDCAQSSLTVEAGEQEFRLEVPCGVCGEKHTAQCASDRFLHGRGVGFACPQTKQLCGFVGELTAVERAVDQLSEAAAKERAQEDGAAFADNTIMYEVLSELKEIAARENGITCACGSAAYAMEVRPTCVDLICKSCGTKLRIPAATDRDLDDLCCHITLKIGGK